MTPAVSIIMPAYNVTAYIPVALDSIFAQSWRDFEIIVVNDGCPDTENLERVLSGYTSRLTYIKQENGGVGAARRAAVLAAQAPLIAQLDPDDWWEPDYLEVQLRLFMESGGRLDLLYPNGTYFGNPALEGKLLMDYARSDGEVTFCAAMETRVNIIYSALIRREAILRAGNFNPDFRTSEDFDLWMRILRTGGKIGYHREPLLHYRLRPESLTANRIAAQSWLVRVLDHLEETTVLTVEEGQSLMNRRLMVQMDMELAMGKDAIASRQWKDAAWHLELYNKHRPSRKLSAVLLMLRSCPWVLGGGMLLRDRMLQGGVLRAKRPQQT